MEFKGQVAWSIHWVPRHLNQQAHLLTQRAARSHLYGFIDVACIPFSISLYDLYFVWLFLRNEFPTKKNVAIGFSQMFWSPADAF